MRRLLLALACVALASCAKVGESTSGYSWPKGTKVFVSPGNRYHYLVPVVLDDGTRCVLAAANQPTAAISCSFPSKP